MPCKLVSLTFMNILRDGPEPPEDSAAPVGVGHADRIHCPDLPIISGVFCQPTQHLANGGAIVNPA